MQRLKARDIFNTSLDDIWNLQPGRYEVVFDDGEIVKTTRRRIIFDRHLWYMLEGINGDVPLTKVCSITYLIGDDGVLNSNTHVTTMNNIFKHIVDHLNLRYYHQKEPLLERAMDTTNLLFNKVLLNVGEHLMSITATDMVSLLKLPEVVEIHEKMYNHPDSIDEAHQALTNWLLTTKTKHPLILCNKAGAVRTTQFNQCVGPRGFVTDLDRTVFGTAIMSGFIRGLHTLYDLATESRTAAKALNAAGFSIRESEYNSRKFAIINMVVGKPIPTDCGSTRLRSCVMSKRYLNNMKGKWYKVNDEDELQCIRGDEEHLIGKVVKYRHINGCQWHHRKDVCTTCAGALSENLKENTNLGAEAVFDFMHDVTQKTLSFKHETKSVSGNALVLNELASKYFKSGEENELYLRREIRNAKFNLILNKNGLDKLMDVLTISTLDIPMSNIGEIVVVGMICEDKKVTDTVKISNDDRKAIITKGLLDYIKTNGFSLDTKGNYVIPLDKWDVTEPIFRIPLKEVDSMAFLRELKIKIESTSKKKITPEEHFFALADLVLERANCNFTILEIMAYGITAFNIEGGNFRLSRNSPNIQIAQRDDLFRRRSKGQLLPYETQLNILMGKPHESFLSENVEGHPLDVQFMPQEMLRGL